VPGTLRPLFRPDDTRNPLQRLVALVRQALALPRLSRPVRRFYLRGLRLARRTGDRYTLDVACRPQELAVLLGVAQGRRRVVELGTATGWTAIALALSDPARQVTTYDPVRREQRERYLELVPEDVRRRIDFVQRPGEELRDERDVDLLFVDSSHEREETIRSFRRWRDRLAPDGTVAFHDFGDPAYPGVDEAIRDLGLRGNARGRLFVWRAADGAR
jgi:predicted O-methyltransferase YrrM